MEKPSTVKDYLAWSKKHLEADWGGKFPRYYESVSISMKQQFEDSPQWQTFLIKLKDLGGVYLLAKNCPLFPNNFVPSLVVKPYDSIVEKGFRKNVLQNLNWPEPPTGGWMTPENFHTSIKDIVRTSVTVKYLDGVEIVASALREVCEASGSNANISLVARDYGYYAGHVDVEHKFEVSSQSWDTITFQGLVEVQITTQVQEVIKQLTHKYYEERRISQTSTSSKQWQWDYTSKEFTANFLGHILHYLEGMILDLRDRERRQ